MCGVPLREILFTPIARQGDSSPQPGGPQPPQSNERPRSAITAAEDRKRRRTGRRQTVLTSPLGDTSPATINRATLG